MAPAAAEAVDELVAELEVLDEAPLWLLPHAAITNVADTASAAVAHALCFTLTSTGPGTRKRLASHSSWVVPQVMPGYLPREEDTRPSGLLVAESEPGLRGIPGLPDIWLSLPPGVFVLSYRLIAWPICTPITPITPIRTPITPGRGRAESRPG
ncbi:MAG: hypothetical protein ACRDOB_02555 [Streptosporangiaceae bacterium]